MAAEKISVTVDEHLMKWARGAAKKRRMTLSAVVAEALELQRQHQARERYLKAALSGIAADEVERRTGEALAKVRGATAIDATVMASAAQRGDRVFTSDPQDMQKLQRHFRAVADIVPV